MVCGRLIINVSSNLETIGQARARWVWDKLLSLGLEVLAKDRLPAVCGVIARGRLRCMAAANARISLLVQTLPVAVILARADR